MISEEGIVRMSAPISAEQRTAIENIAEKAMDPLGEVWGWCAAGEDVSLFHALRLCLRLREAAEAIERALEEPREQP
jgi:hypothetical protein